jgi:hypothetical protein
MTRVSPQDFFSRSKRTYLRARIGTSRTAGERSRAALRSRSASRSFCTSRAGARCTLDSRASAPWGGWPPQRVIGRLDPAQDGYGSLTGRWTWCQSPAP